VLRSCFVLPYFLSDLHRGLRASCARHSPRIIIIITIKKEASAFVGGDALGNHLGQSQQSRLE
jgi:hypothetical protein